MIFFIKVDVLRSSEGNVWEGSEVKCSGAVKMDSYFEACANGTRDSECLTNAIKDSISSVNLLQLENVP